MKENNLILVLCIVFVTLLFTTFPKKEVPNKEMVTYDLSIIDEHEVRLTTKKDTIILYFENATVLSEETTVFVKK